MSEPKHTFSRVHNRLYEEHYRLDGWVGSCAGCELYRAHDLHSENQVLIWIAPPRQMQRINFCKEFENQSILEPKLRHPNIVRVHGSASVEDEITYLIEEFVSEQTLSDLLRTETFSLLQALLILVSIAEALKHAHSRKVIHGMLTPKNILISTKTNPWTIKIRGFNGAYLPVLQSIYFAPEQRFDSTKITQTVDIWALGVLMHEILTGQLPTEPMEISKMLYIQLHSQLPKTLSSLISSCLQKDYFLRPTIKEVLEELRTLTSINSKELVSAFDFSWSKTGTLNEKKRNQFVQDKTTVSEPIHVKTNRCEYTIWFPKPHVFHTKLIGFFDKKSIVPAFKALGQMDFPQIELFCDWSEMTGYDSEVRLQCTEWALKNLHRSTVHFLIHSKLVAMGISVAQLALKKPILRAYTDSKQFETALQAACSNVKERTYSKENQ